MTWIRRLLAAFLLPGVVIGVMVGTALSHRRKPTPSRGSFSFRIRIFSSHPSRV
jgi:uncharacterized membrane protein YfcA